MVVNSEASSTEHTVGNSELGSQFNLAMSTYVNEIDNDRHLQMQFDEFVEAIARVADKINNYPLSSDSDIFELELKHKMSSKKKKDSSTKLQEIVKTEPEKSSKVKVVNMTDQPLHVKLDMFIRLLR